MPTGMPPTPSTRRRPLVLGHRGARGLAPENTVASVGAAFEAGVDGIELDVQLSADGHVVVWHDPVIQAEKCTGAPELIGRPVGGLTLPELRRLDVGSLILRDFPRQRACPGERVTTLGEVLTRFRDESRRGAWWTIELKFDPTDPAQPATREALVEGVVTAVREAGIDRQCHIHSFDWACLEWVEQVAPDLSRSALADPGLNWHEESAWLGRRATFGSDLAAAAVMAGATILAPHHLMVDAALVSRAHDLGLEVFVWTVNEEHRARELAELGVDMICTDDPAELGDVSDGLG